MYYCHCYACDTLYFIIDAKAAIADKDKKKTTVPVAKAPRLPEFVTVELQPNNNAACQRMSDISHNPNLRVKVKSEQGLSTLIETLEKKWVPSSVRFVSFWSSNYVTSRFWKLKKTGQKSCEL